MPPPRRQAALSHIGEFQLIQSITSSQSHPSPEIILGIGDDAAILDIPKGRHLVISTDMLVEQIHFNRRHASFFEIGYKAAVANLSDMAAMGAHPTALLVSVALPTALTFQNWKDLYRGLSAPCGTHQVPIIGGDTSSSPSHMFLSVTIVGTVKKGCALRRSGAKKGHSVYVSGTLGDSSAGLDYLQTQTSRTKVRGIPLNVARHLVRRHFRPTPKIALGKLLGNAHWASAAIDISDGLSSDLGHLCQQSRVGAIIQADHLPLSTSLKDYAACKNGDSLTWALHGGEDYELLFTVPPQYGKKVEEAAQQHSLPITKIGVITSYQAGIRLQDAAGNLTALPPGGYNHFPS